MKIIFLDDSQIVLDTLKALVQEMIDSNMITCDFLNDSTAAMDMLRTQCLEYDLMFLDINMPNITGYDIAKYAKSIHKYKYKPIIAITTEFSDESVELGKEAGIDGWFVKSVNEDSLHSSIIEKIKQLYKI